MLKSVVFAVKVGEEVFGAFRQVENGLKVDDFGTCCGDIREIARQKLKISELVGAYIHNCYVGEK